MKTGVVVRIVGHAMPVMLVKMMIEKSKPIRSKKIRDSARGEKCSLRLPAVCNYDESTTIFAHAPSADKGMGIKSPDWWGCYSCSACHDAIDGRVKYPHSDSYVTLSLIQAIYETQKKLINKGLIEVK